MSVPVGRSPYSVDHEEALLSANYTKKDRAAKQQALFPQLEEAIAEGRKAASTGVIWPDQRTAAYQEEVCKKADPLVHKRITPQQRQRLFTRVLKPFSMVFWMLGCNAPRVAGFTAHLDLKDGAQPRIQQPYKLFRFG